MNPRSYAMWPAGLALLPLSLVVLAAGCAAEPSSVAGRDDGQAQAASALAHDVGVGDAGRLRGDSTGTDDAADSPASTCELPSAWPGVVQKVSKVKIPAGSVGCDLNGDGQPDNAVGAGLAQIDGPTNDQFAANLAQAQLVLLLSALDYRDDGMPFELEVAVGNLAPADLACNPTAEQGDCAYQVSAHSYDTAATDQVCPVKLRFPNARVQQGKLTAGGVDQTFVLAMPVQNLTLNLQLLQARVEGEVVGAAGWQQTKNGLLCGVLTKTALGAAIDALPEAQVAKMGFSKPMLKGALTSFLVADVATTGGAPDAYSVALVIETVPGRIVGLSAQP